MGADLNKGAKPKISKLLNKIDKEKINETWCLKLSSKKILQ